MAGYSEDRTFQKHPIRIRIMLFSSLKMGT